MKPNIQISRCICLAMLLFASATLAKAQTIRGMQSCGVWTKTQQQPDSVPRLAGEHWLIGYLSGLAMGTSKDFIKGTDNASILLWMDNYCKANPLKHSADGADALYFELIRQKRL